MRHASVTGRHINIVFHSAAFVSGDQRHMHIVILNFGKKYGLLVKPLQPRSIGQPQARLTPKHGHDQVSQRFFASRVVYAIHGTVGEKTGLIF